MDIFETGRVGEDITQYNCVRLNKKSAYLQDIGNKQTPKYLNDCLYVTIPICVKNFISGYPQNIFFRLCL